MVGSRAFCKILIVTALVAGATGMATPAGASDKPAGAWTLMVTRLETALQPIQLWFSSSSRALQTKEGALPISGGKEGALPISGGTPIVAAPVTAGRPIARTEENRSR